MAESRDPLGSARKDRKRTQREHGEHNPWGHENGWVAMPQSQHLALQRRRGGRPALRWKEGRMAGGSGGAERPKQLEKMQDTQLTCNPG